MAYSKISSLGKDGLQKILDESESFASVLDKLGMSRHGGNYSTLRKYIEEFDCDLTTITQNREVRNNAILDGNRKQKTICLEDIIFGRYKQKYKGSVLKDRLIKAGYKIHQCERCGLTEWLGDPIPLQMHHKDGNHDNNLLENLELLCPNCHALTDTFAGKNIIRNPVIKDENSDKRVKRGVSADGQRYYDGYGNYKILCPICGNFFMSRTSKMCKSCYEKDRLLPKISKDELYEAIAELKSYTKVGKMLGFDRKTISRWHRYYASEDNESGIVVIASENAPSRDVLKDEIRNMGFGQIGRIHGGVNGNTVKKWCIRYGLPYLRDEINSMDDEAWDRV